MLHSIKWTLSGRVIRGGPGRELRRRLRVVAPIVDHPLHARYYARLLRTDQNQMVAHITGASSGIGRATARLLAEHGAMVMLGARREDALAAVDHEIAAAGSKVAHRVKDVRH